MSLRHRVLELVRAVLACPPGSLNVTVALPAVASMPPGTCMRAALSLQLAAATKPHHHSPESVPNSLSFLFSVSLACQHGESAPARKACSRMLQYGGGDALSRVSSRNSRVAAGLTGSRQNDAMEETFPCVDHGVADHCRPIGIRGLIDSFRDVPAKNGLLHMSHAFNVTKL